MTSPCTSFFFLKCDASIDNCIGLYVSPSGRDSRWVLINRIVISRDCVATAGALSLISTTTPDRDCDEYPKCKMHALTTTSDLETNVTFP